MVVYVPLSEVPGSPGDQTRRTKAAPPPGMMRTTCRVWVSGLRGNPTQGPREWGVGSEEAWGGEGRAARLPSEQHKSAGRPGQRRPSPPDLGIASERAVRLVRGLR